MLFAFEVESISASSLAPLTLATEGATSYRILVADQAPPAEQYAAAELAKTLKEMTSAVFSIVRDANTSSGSLMVIGRNELFEQVMGAKAVDEIPSEDGFRIATRGPTIFLTGKSPRATIYAVYYFLEEYLGCRWYAAGHSIIPKRKTVTINNMDVVQKPRFQYREVFSNATEDIAFRVRNRLSGQFGHRAQLTKERKFGEARKIQNITTFELINPTAYKNDHPEYFGNGQLRFGNPAVQQLATEAVRMRLRSSRNLPTYLLIEPEDRETYFNQGEDRLLIEKGRSAATAYVEFVRTIANGVHSEFPSVKILALAYQWSIKPPLVDPLPENMGIMLSDIDVDFSIPFTSEENRIFLEHLQGWSQLTGEIIIWDYITNFANYLQPYPNIPTLVQNLRILAAEPSVVGVFQQGAYSSLDGELPGPKRWELSKVQNLRILAATPSEVGVVQQDASSGVAGEFSELKAWLLSRLLWDPQLDATELINDFASGYYGAGAPYVLEYLALLQNAITRSPTRLEVKMPLVSPYLSAELLTKADSLFQEAEKLVRDDVPYLRHIRGARLSVDYAILATDALNESDNEWAARFRRFREYLRQLNVTTYREGTGEAASVERLLEVLTIPYSHAPLPAPCADQATENCVQVQERSFRLAGQASFVTDQPASDGVAVRMKGNSQVWGVQVPLDWILPEEGTWRVWIDVRIQKKDWWTDTPAFSAGIYPGVKKVVNAGVEDASHYQSFALPGQWRRDSERMIWIAPSGSESIQHIYVDRIFAVRVQH